MSKKKKVSKLKWYVHSARGRREIAAFVSSVILILLTLWIFRADIIQFIFGN